MAKKGNYLFLLLLFLTARGFGQQQPKITIKDVKDIKFAAVEAIANYERFLGQYTYVNNSATDLKDFFQGALDQSSGNRIFVSKTINVRTT